MKMTKENFKDLLGNGFNIDELANQFTTLTNGQIRPAGRIRELIHEPVEGEVYHYADINTNAVYNFALKYNIDLDQIDYDAVLAKKTNTSKTLEIGQKTSRGVIKQIAKVAGCYMYLIEDEKTGQNIMLKKSEI